MKLPETDQDLVALYQVELKQLGRIAMKGLENDSMYFDQSAFQGFSSDLKSGLGFLTVEAGRSKRRPGRSYGFLHKSFQEPIRCIDHSFFWMDLGKNLIRCINHSFFWMDPGKIPSGVYSIRSFGCFQEKSREVSVDTN